MPKEIKIIGNSLLSINKSIEQLRSKRTKFHGNNDLIYDSMYGYFIINSVATIGLFLISFYRKNFDIINANSDIIEDDIEIPF